MADRSMQPAATACPGADRIALSVNGEQFSIEAGATVADLIAQLGLAEHAVAVEVNLDLVTRARHARAVLGDGDRIEIVTLVGGG